MASMSLVLASCRFGFDEQRLDLGDDAAIDDDAAADDAALVDAMIDAPNNAVTVTFGERATATFQGVTADTYISNETGEPGLNYGASDDLRSEQDVSERILMKFTVTGIPSTATVLSASLDVEVVNENPLATWELHPLLEDWVEGSLDGTTGVANFVNRNLTTAWATAGAGMPNSAGPTFATAVPAVLGVLSITIPAATVQGWVTTPATNFGFIFYNTHTNSARIASSEEATQFRPLLSVTYVP